MRSQLCLRISQAVGAQRLGEWLDVPYPTAPDRPATDVDVLLHEEVPLIMVQHVVQFPPVAVFSHCAPGTSFHISLQGKPFKSSFVLPQKEDVPMGNHLVQF